MKELRRTNTSTKTWLINKQVKISLNEQEEISDDMDWEKRDGEEMLAMVEME